MLNLVVASLILSDSTAHLKMIQMKSTVIHKSQALGLSLYDCVLYKYFDAIFF